MKDAYYFSHDSNARNDEKMLQIRAKYGWEGYGLFFGIVEILRDSTDYKINTSLIGGLSLALNYPNDKLSLFIEECVKINLLTRKNGYIWSESLLARMRIRDEKKALFIESGRRGAEKRWHTDSNPNSPPNSKVKESKVKKIKEKNKIPPTIDLILTFFKEKLYPELEAHKFNNYYCSNGWKVGKNPMKDWHAACRNWFTRITPKNKPQPAVIHTSDNLPERAPIDEKGTKFIKGLVNDLGKKVDASK